MWSVIYDAKAPDGGANPRVEQLNAVVYVTYVHPDGRAKTPDDSVAANVRVPFDPDDLHQPETFLAQKCAVFNAADDRVARISAALPTRVFAAGAVTLPDLSARIAADAATAALQQKLNAALLQQQISDLSLVDASIPAAVTAQAAAVAAMK